MEKSMTSGNPLLLIIKFALPLLAGNILQQTYNIIDAAIVGRTLGANALASVGASSSVQFLVLGFCIGICCGFGIPIAKCFGAKDYKTMRQYIFHAAVLTMIAAVLLTVVCALLCPQILHVLSTPKNIFANAYAYLLIIFLGIPATLLYNLLSSILRSIGDSKTPFIFLAISTVLNIFLDLFCIIVLDLGCAGAAIATITAQAVSGILCLLFIKKRHQILHLSREDYQKNGKVVGNLLLMGLPMGLQYSITAIGSMVMQSANNGLGSIYVSGFTAGMRIKQFFLCPFDALATASSVYCGQNLGAGDIKRVKRGLKSAMGISVVYGIVAGMILIFAGRTLSMIFVSSSAVEILDASSKYLRYLGFFFWILGILNVTRMTTQGLGYSGRAVISGIAEMVARTIVSVVFVGTYGFTAICFADQAAWISATCYILPICISCVNKLGKKYGLQS